MDYTQNVGKMNNINTKKKIYICCTISLPFLPFLCTNYIPNIKYTPVFLAINSKQYLLSHYSGPNSILYIVVAGWNTLVSDPEV